MVWWLWEETNFLKVVCSNPRTVYWMDILLVIKTPTKGSHGLVVMRGDSCPESPGFESQHRILDGHFIKL